jgi:hypothetical protein
MTEITALLVEKGFVVMPAYPLAGLTMDMIVTARTGLVVLISSGIPETLNRRSHWRDTECSNAQG